MHMEQECDEKVRRYLSSEAEKNLQGDLPDFAIDICIGLQSDHKKISSKYLYDDEGSRLFQKIMALEEYYPTRCETEIFKSQKDRIVKAFGPTSKKVNLIELGAGDGVKTKIILGYLQDTGIRFSYSALDISSKALGELMFTIKKELGDIEINIHEGDYFERLSELKSLLPSPKVVMFLGSNIGNYSNSETLDFLSQIRKSLQPGDKLLIGYDLKKSPDIILKAYNDKAGVTRDFNLNLLKRINRELGGNFRMDNFDHFPVYDGEKGEARSYLKSKIKHNVRIEKLNLDVGFESGELIHTEISRKYSFEQMIEMAGKTGFSIIENFVDQAGYFCDSVWEAI